VLAMLAGLAIVYAFGTTWLALSARTLSGNAAIGFSAALATGVLPFAIPDVLKVAAAAGIVPSVWRLIGRR